MGTIFSNCIGVPWIYQKNDEMIISNNNMKFEEWNEFIRCKLQQTKIGIGPIIDIILVFLYPQPNESFYNRFKEFSYYTNICAHEENFDIFINMQTHHGHLEQPSQLKCSLLRILDHDLKNVAELIVESDSSHTIDITRYVFARFMVDKGNAIMKTYENDCVFLVLQRLRDDDLLRHMLNSYCNIDTLHHNKNVILEIIGRFRKYVGVGVFSRVQVYM